MSTDHAEVVAKAVSEGKKFRNLRLAGASFKGMNLKNADFRNASLPGADFSDCDLTYANFEGANCFACNFQGAKCYRTNFKDANLSDTNMECTDLYGATITLECKSFMGMKPKPGWWYGWIFYALLMQPPSAAVRDKLIEFMGTERYEVLRSQYVRRGL